jgi:hypothetical protein
MLGGFNEEIEMQNRLLKRDEKPELGFSAPKRSIFQLAMRSAHAHVWKFVFTVIVFTSVYIYMTFASQY